MRRLFLFLGCLLSVAAYSQDLGTSNYRASARSARGALYNRYIDSLTIYKERIDSLTVEQAQEQREGSTAEEHSARYMRLFTPMVYHPDLIHRHFSLDDEAALLNDDKRAVDDALMNIYINHPTYVQRFKRGEEDDDDEFLMSQHKVETTPLTEAFELPQIYDQDFEGVDLVIKKPNFWTLSGEFYLQAMQNYYSANWYQGIETNYSWLTKVTLQANYNNKQKVTWDNKLEMNLGFQTDRSDEVHKLKPSEDLLRYTGKVGLQATKNWYYTFQVVANTQFMRSYASNSHDINSAFLTPLNLNTSIGMSYNVSLCKGRLTGSVYLSPIALNFKYVHDLARATANGIDEGKHSMVDFGSTFTIEGTWEFNNIVSWKFRLYGYTPYDRIELQWENTINVKVSKIIALTLYVYPRFDDSSPSLKDKGFGYFQLKEYTSFGLTYSF